MNVAIPSSNKNRGTSIQSETIAFKKRWGWVPYAIVAIVSFSLGTLYNNGPQQPQLPPTSISTKSSSSNRVEVEVDPVVDDNDEDDVGSKKKRQLPSFREIGESTNTDKTWGYEKLKHCLSQPNTCLYPNTINEKCRTWGHFYDTIYDKYLGPFAHPDSGPMQFLEIGFYRGSGFEAYTKFLASNPQAELHSMEISCIEQGPRNEGKWPWGNFAKSHRWYEKLLKADRLHCGDASDYKFLINKWTNKMKRPDSPPLMVVVDDGAHIDDQMAASMFFWLPRIHPGGILVMEDIQPIHEPNPFRTHYLPQIMKDLHWCGSNDPENENKILPDSRCFPTIQPLIQGIHCEMHICVFVRNDVPATEPDQTTSSTPHNAHERAKECLFGPHNFDQ